MDDNNEKPKRRPEAVPVGAGLYRIKFRVDELPDFEGATIVERMNRLLVRDTIAGYLTFQFAMPDGPWHVERVIPHGVIGAIYIEARFVASSLPGEQLCEVVLSSYTPDAPYEASIDAVEILFSRSAGFVRSVQWSRVGADPEALCVVPQGVPEVRVVLLKPGAMMPRRGTEGSSGLDLFAYLNGARMLRPGARMLVPTGIEMAIPAGYEGQVRSRSGLTINHGLVVANGIGTIDHDYRGEIGVPLINHGEETVTIYPGDRVAQLVIVPVPPVVLVEHQGELPKTRRDKNGFGSTGV